MEVRVGLGSVLLTFGLLSLGLPIAELLIQVGRAKRPDGSLNFPLGFRDIVQLSEPSRRFTRGTVLIARTLATDFVTSSRAISNKASPGHRTPKQDHFLVPHVDMTG